jgi:hypothetical protein
MKLKATTHTAELTPGLYRASLDMIEDKDGEHGTYLVWTFVVEQPDGRTVDVTALSSAKFSPKAKARQWVEALLRRTLHAGEEVDTDLLIGRECQILVDLQPLDDGGSRNVVDRLLPLDGAGDDDVPF